jgi:hypothetical protein
MDDKLTGAVLHSLLEAFPKVLRISWVDGERVTKALLDNGLTLEIPEKAPKESEGALRASTGEQAATMRQPPVVTYDRDLANRKIDELWRKNRELNDRLQGILAAIKQNYSFDHPAAGSVEFGMNVAYAVVASYAKISITCPSKGTITMEDV